MRFGDTPHPIPYQGSKRQLAPLILSFVPTGRFETLIEPFVGSGAVALATAQKDCCANTSSSVTSWSRSVGFGGRSSTSLKPSRVRSTNLWHGQFPDPIAFFNRVREEFSNDRTPSKLLFLLARCVKNAVRFNPSGGFNQSADKRRLGTQPKRMSAEIMAAHRLLQGKCEVRPGDYKAALDAATANDLVYMDPPYQGTSGGVGILAT